MTLSKSRRAELLLLVEDRILAATESQDIRTFTDLRTALQDQTTPSPTPPGYSLLREALTTALKEALSSNCKYVHVGTIESILATPLAEHEAMEPEVRSASMHGLVRDKPTHMDDNNDIVAAAIDRGELDGDNGRDEPQQAVQATWDKPATWASEPIAAPAQVKPPAPHDPVLRNVQQVPGLPAGWTIGEFTDSSGFYFRSPSGDGCTFDSALEKGYPGDTVLGELLRTLMANAGRVAAPAQVTDEEAEAMFEAYMRDQGTYLDSFAAAGNALLALRSQGGVAQGVVVAEIAARIVRDVAELPDRDSPEGWPEAMIVTGDELRSIVADALAPQQTEGGR